MLDTDNFQGNAVVNYTDSNTAFTSIIEHKHFEFGMQYKTVITREYPSEWKPVDEPYYPINDDRNNTLFMKYKELADSQDSVIFWDRLANYKYYDMQVVIGNALETIKNEFNKKT